MFGAMLSNFMPENAMKSN